MKFPGMEIRRGGPFRLPDNHTPIQFEPDPLLPVKTTCISTLMETGMSIRVTVADQCGADRLAAALTGGPMDHTGSVARPSANERICIPSWRLAIGLAVMKHVAGDLRLLAWQFTESAGAGPG